MLKTALERLLKIEKLYFHSILILTYHSELSYNTSRRYLCWIGNKIYEANLTTSMWMK